MKGMGVDHEGYALVGNEDREELPGSASSGTLSRARI